MKDKLLFHSKNQLFKQIIDNNTLLYIIRDLNELLFLKNEITKIGEYQSSNNKTIEKRSTLLNNRFANKLIGKFDKKIK